METLIISGIGASGTIFAPSGLGISIKAVQVDVPINESTSGNPVIILSGAITGAINLHNSAFDINQRYTIGENIIVTSSNFTNNYSAIISYIYVGDQSAYMQTRQRAVMPQSFRS